MRMQDRMDEVRNILSDAEERLEEIIYDMDADLATEEAETERLEREIEDMKYQAQADAAFNERH